MKENKYCVYKHTNKINGKVYIGQTGQTPENRWLEGKGYIGCTHFYNAIQKYGWDNFEHEIVYNCLSFEEANNYEKELIELYDSTNSEKGYNLMTGGVKSRPCEITRQRMSESRKGEKNPFYGKKLSKEHKEKLRKSHLGKKLSEETKKKISEGNKGKVFSEETRKKLSEANKGRTGVWKGKHLPEETRKKISEAQKGEKGHMYGKHLSEEARRKISEAGKGREVSEETRSKISKALSKPILCVETGEVFRGITEAERQTGNNHSNLVACLKGRQKTCGGYHWKYVEENQYDEIVNIPKPVLEEEF